MENKKVFEVPSDLPEAKSFSSLNVNGNSDEDSAVDFGDNGEHSEDMVAQIQADFLLLNILFKLNDRQKVVLLYQIIRDIGYGLNYTEYAKTLSITRQKYLIMLKGVRVKAGKVLKENNQERTF